LWHYLSELESKYFDIGVIGGGPAGSTTALCLARAGRKVAIYEAEGFDHPRYGETLPPEINPLLRRLELWDGFLSTNPLESPGIVSVWGGDSPHEQDFVRNVHGCGWHVDRARFDEMLWRRAGAEGVALFPGTRVRPRELPCDFVVHASGRNPADAEDVLVAIVVRLLHSNGRSMDLRTCIEAVPNGWWYCAPLPGAESIAMFFTDRETYGQGIVLGEQLELAASIRARIGDAKIADSRVVHVISGIGRNIKGDNWIAVGDCAASHDPLSGFGVFQAISGGESAASAIRNGTIPQYVSAVRENFANYRRQRGQFYAAEQRWPEAGFWQRRRMP